MCVCFYLCKYINLLYIKSKIYEKIAPAPASGSSDSH